MFFFLTLSFLQTHESAEYIGSKLGLAFALAKPLTTHVKCFGHKVLRLDHFRSCEGRGLARFFVTLHVVWKVTLRRIWKVRFAREGDRQPLYILTMFLVCYVSEKCDASVCWCWR